MGLSRDLARWISNLKYEDLPPEVVDRVRSEAVLQRAADAGDIASQVVTFCRADSVTGQVVVIDGGLHFH